MKNPTGIKLCISCHINLPLPEDPLLKICPNKSNDKNYLQRINWLTLQAYSAGHYHPVLLQSWPWHIQDPTHQKHPRLDSADIGVGPVQARR